MKKKEFKNPLPKIGKWLMRHKYVLLVACLVTCAVGSLLYFAHADINKRTDGKGVQVDIPHEVMHHLADSYDWHFTTFGETHVTLHLPIIVKSCVDASGMSSHRMTFPTDSILTRIIMARYMSVLLTAHLSSLGISV